MNLRRLDKPSFGGFANRAQKASEKIGDGVVRDGLSLRVDREADGPAPERTKTERARLFLEALRMGNEEDALTFGNQIRGGIDAITSLKSYYPSLEVANALLEAFPEGAGGIANYLDAVSVPDDLRALLDTLVQGGAFGPVGNVATWEQDPDYNTIYAQWQANNLEVTKINDATALKLFGVWGFPTANFHQYIQNRPDDFKVGMVRTLARGVELGAACQTPPANIGAQLPATEEGAGALKRLCAAMNVAENTVNFHGRLLAQWQGRGARPRAEAHVVANNRPGRPLGNVKTWVNEANYNNWWAAFQRADPNTVAVDDETVRKIFAVWQVGNAINQFGNVGDTNFKTGVIAMFARAKELGINVQAHPQHINAIANQIPVTPAAVRALHRIRQAFGLQPNQLTLANQLLQDLPAAKGEAAILPEPAVCGRKTGDLAAVQKLIADVDDAVLRLDDAALGVLAQASQLNALGQKSGEADWHLGLVQLATRSVHLGVRNLNDFQQYVQTIPNHLLADPRIGRALAMAVRQVGLNPQAPLANGLTLSTCEDVGPHIRSLDRVLDGAFAPLPTKRARPESLAAPLGQDGAGHQAYWQGHDQRFFELNDAGVQPFHGNQIQQMLNHWQGNPLVFKFMARVVELNPAGNAANYSRAFLQAPVAAAYVNDDAVIYMARLAKALNVDPNTIQIQSPGGQIALSNHPALKKPAEDNAGERIAALHADVAELDPANDKHAAEKEGAVMRLLFSDTEILHELPELFAAIITARSAGKLEPVDLMGVPKDYAERFLSEALESTPHIGASALLIGLLAKAPVGVIRNVLAGQGYFPAQVDRFADFANTLSRMPSDEIGFVLADLARDADDPDFPAIELRVELTKKSVDAGRLEALFEDNDPTTVLRAVLDRAAQLPDGKPRKDLLAFVDGLVAKEVITEGDVHACLALDSAVRLDEGRVAKLEKVVRSTIANVDGGFDALAADLQDGSKYLDATALTTHAMRMFYERDLQHVAPLGQTDEILGGVKGKAWDMRAQDDVERTTIEGVALPIDTRADRSVHAVPKMDAPAALLTPSGKKALRLIAARWRVPGPMTLAGPGASDLEAAVPFIAAQTKTAYRKIHLDDLEDAASLVSADGPLMTAAKKGEIVHLVATRPISPELTQLLQTAFDSKGNIVPPPPGQPVNSDSHFRLVLSEGRRGGNVQPALLPAFSTLNMRAFEAKDISKLLREENRKLPEGLADQLGAMHLAVDASLVAGNFGDPPPAIGLGRVQAIARRVANLPQDADGNIDPNLVRRAAQEVYSGVINPAWIGNLEGPLQQSIGGAVPPVVEVETGITKGNVTVGGVTILRDKAVDALKPEDIEALGLTPQMANVLRVAAEAIENGEAVNLLGPVLPALVSIEESYALLSARPFARYIATPSTPVTDFIDPATGEFRAEFDGAVIVIEAFDEATAAFRDTLTAAASRSRADGEGVRLITRTLADVPNQNPAVPAEMTVVRLDAIKDADGEQAIVESAAKRMGLAPSVAKSLYALHGRVNQAYQGNVIGRNLNPKPSYGLNELFGAMKLALELIPEIGMASAYLTSVETFYGARLPADTDQIVAIAREIAR